MARDKAGAAAQAFPGQLALGADTVVAVGEEALGKPRDEQEATAMLRRLRGAEHQVITAVALAHSAGGAALLVSDRVSIARVLMRDYSDEEIAAYVASGDPLDKAGAYAIQDPRFRPVARVEGCFLSVVGLPLPEVYELLAEADVPVPQFPRAALNQLCPSCSDLTRLPLGPERDSG